MVKSHSIAVSFHRKNSFSCPEKNHCQYTLASQDGNDLTDYLISVHAQLQQLVEQAATASRNKHLDVVGAAMIVDALTNSLHAIFEVMRKEVREQCKEACDGTLGNSLIRSCQHQ